MNRQMSQRIAYAAIDRSRYVSQTLASEDAASFIYGPRFRLGLLLASTSDQVFELAQFLPRDTLITQEFH
jgi:hypothetical protein